MKLEWHNEKRKIKDLIPYENNPRQLSEKQYADLKKSLEKFNIAEIPAINTDNKICAGHQRLKILAEIYGSDSEIDVRVPNRKLTPKEFKELNVRSNKNTGSWDFDLLANNYDLPDLMDWGFEDYELDMNLWNDKTDEQLDEVPEVQKEAVSQLGDLFLIDSRHRLLCGDSTLGKDVSVLMDGKKANLIMTSPPYWVGKDYENEGSEEEINKFIHKSVIQIIECAKDDYSRIVINTGTCRATSLKSENKTRVILLLDKWINEFYVKGWYLRYIRNWIKGGGNARPRRPIDDVVYSGIEYLLTFYNINGKSRGQNRLDYAWMQQSDWTGISGDRQENKAGYPVELPKRYIELYTSKNEIVTDIFMGNGTTLIACQQTNRICYGMEICGNYIDVILKRYKNLYPEAKFECLNREFDFKKLFEIKEAA